MNKLNVSCSGLVGWPATAALQAPSTNPHDPMPRLVLDSNVFDELERDERTRTRLARLAAAGTVEVIVPYTVQQELAAGPLQGVPKWFPITLEHDSVTVLPFVLGTSRLGSGETYRTHLGESRTHMNDAKITDAASTYYADVLVSQDRRCRSRAAKTLGPKCQCLDYAGLVGWIENL